MNIDFSQWTDRARKVIRRAHEQASYSNHPDIQPDHIFLAILGDCTSAAAIILRSHGIPFGEASRHVMEMHPLSHEKLHLEQCPYSPAAKKTLKLALREGKKRGHNYIGTEHLLMALLCQPQAIPCRVLAKMGHDVEAIKKDFDIRISGWKP